MQVDVGQQSCPDGTGICFAQSFSPRPKSARAIMFPVVGKRPAETERLYPPVPRNREALITSVPRFISAANFGRSAESFVRSLSMKRNTEYHPTVVTPVRSALP